MIAEVERAVEACVAAFNNADVKRLAACLAPEFILKSPRGELHGREEAANYFRQYFGSRPQAHLSIMLSDERAAGDVVWGLCDYTIRTASKHSSGRGLMLLRKSGDRWYILSIQEWPFVTAIEKPR